jgi:hypothetical protein
VLSAVRFREDVSLYINQPLIISPYLMAVVGGGQESGGGEVWQRRAICLSQVPGAEQRTRVDSSIGPGYLLGSMPRWKPPVHVDKTATKTAITGGWG